MTHFVYMEGSVWAGRCFQWQTNRACQIRWPMNQSFRMYLAVSALSMLGAACVPFPCTTPVAPGADGFVQDSRTKQPVAGATITAERAGYRAKTHSSKSGFYGIPSLRQWHFLIYLGSPGLAPTPWYLASPHSMVYTVTASAPGYQPSSRTFGPSPGRQKGPSAVLAPRSINFSLQRTAR